MGAATTRRRFLLSTGTLAAGLYVGADATAEELAATPSCDRKGATTLRQTEGPFFKPRSPERADLREPGTSARIVELSGLVLSRGCKPLGRALIDLWHADEHGDYDNAGFRYRGHLYTDADGRYRFRSIVPAVYPGRTRHYHVKVQAPGSRLLTTQLYFPDEPQNARDGLFRRELLMRTSQADGAIAAGFDFVLDLR